MVIVRHSSGPPASCADPERRDQDEKGSTPMGLGVFIPPAFALTNLESRPAFLVYLRRAHADVTVHGDTPRIPAPLIFDVSFDADIPRHSIESTTAGVDTKGVGALEAAAPSVSAGPINRGRFTFGLLRAGEPAIQISVHDDVLRLAAHIGLLPDHIALPAVGQQRPRLPSQSPVACATLPFEGGFFASAICGPPDAPCGGRPLLTGFDVSGSDARWAHHVRVSRTRQTRGVRRLRRDVRAAFRRGTAGSVGHVDRPYRR